MGWYPCVLKNFPNDDVCNDPIVIKKGDPLWEEAYKNWLDQKNPTSDPKWKLGVYMGCCKGDVK
jgi:hypothetical protein